MNPDYKKYLLMLGALALLGQNVILVSGQLSYREIGDQLISSYGLITEKQEQQKEEDARLDIPTLSDQEQRKIAFDILAAQDQFNNSKTSLQQEALRLLVSDLELLYARDAQDHSKTIFATLKKTDTKFGEAVLAKMLTTPTTDQAVLRNRQEFIAALVKDEALFTQCQSIIDELKNAENAFYSLWREDNKATKDLIAALYPVPGKGMLGTALGGANKSPAALEMYTRLGNLGTLYQCIGDYLIIGLEFYAMKKMFEKMGIPSSLPDSLSGNIASILTVLSPLTYAKVWQQLGDPKAQTISLMGSTIPVPAKGVDPRMDQLRTYGRAGAAYMGSCTTALLGYKLYVVKKAYEAARIAKNTANLLQSRLIGAATFVNSFKKLVAMTSEHNVMAAGFDNKAQSAISEFDDNADFNELMHMLQSNTFKGEASFFSYTGRVLAAYTYMQDNKDNFASLLELLGTLDAYLSIAKLVKQQEKERVTYCFVHYQDNDNPYLNMQQFWNPQIDPAVVVPNNLVLGGSEKTRDVILTGSNTGGKSTVLKAMGLSVLMAQTIGIAPAQSMTLTPFDYFSSSMNIIDNTAQGKSLYQAEVDRAAMLMNAAQHVQKQGGKSFIIMDELFRGTKPEKADQETYECAQHLSEMDSVLFVLATHYFNNPLKLEKLTGGIVKNYKIDAYIDASGNIVRTFTLEPGVSQNNIAGELLHKALRD